MSAKQAVYVIQGRIFFMGYEMRNKNYYTEKKKFQLERQDKTTVKNTVVALIKLLPFESTYSNAEVARSTSSPISHEDARYQKAFD